MVHVDTVCIMGSVHSIPKVWSRDRQISNSTKGQNISHQHCKRYLEWEQLVVLVKYEVMCFDGFFPLCFPDIFGWVLKYNMYKNIHNHFQTLFIDFIPCKKWGGKTNIVITVQRRRLSDTNLSNDGHRMTLQQTTLLILLVCHLQIYPMTVME